PAQVLVSVGDEQVTARDLEVAIRSAPFATQFNTMDADDQAALRGDLLERLVAARLLLLEAQRLGLDRQPELRRELEDYRTGRLYRSYMDRLRARLRIGDADMAELSRQFGDDPDALAAARSSLLSEMYREQRLALLRELRARYRVELHDERIDPNAADDTLLLEADGMQIRMGDLRHRDGESPTSGQLRERLLQRAELLLVARAAEDEGIGVDEEVATFRAERLPGLLLERMEQEWVPGESAMRAYFGAHPEIGRIAERRHIGQLVVDSEARAQALRERILAGESLFRLAGRVSVDPEGRAHNGDMGWLRAGTGMPEIETAIAELPDGQVSEVIHTPNGYHLVIILERKPGRQLPFDAVRDRVRQQMIAERMPAYVQGLQERYQVAWKLLDAGGSRAAPRAGGRD
ncbi:MAG: peptidylprolyl isomerase, partial [Chromatiales bacterium]